MAEGTAILWPGFCGNRSAYDAFWNDSISINTATPELTPCFQKTVLLWIPCGWLILSAILYIPYLVREPTVNRFGRTSCLNTWKMVLVVLLVLLAVLDLAETIARGSDPPNDLSPLPVDYTEVVVKTVTMVLAAFLTGYSFRKGQHTSGVLFTFWLLMALCGCLQAYSLSAQRNRQGGVTEVYRFSSYYIQFGLSVILFVSNIPSDMGAFPKEHQGSESEDDERAPLIPKKKDVEDNKNPCPRDSANFLSHAFLAWYWGLVVKGYKKTLTYADMWDIRPEDASENIQRRFQKVWGPELEANEKTGKAPSLLWALTRGFNWKIVLATLLLVLSTTTSLVNPQVMNAVINFVQSSNPYTWQGYLLALTLFCLSVLGCVLMQQCYSLPCHVGQHLKSAVIASVYRKALRISNTARKTTTTGEVVNLMSVDAERLSDSMVFIHFLWVTPFTVVVTMVFIYQKLGPASLVGLAYLVIVLPLNSWLLGRFTRKYQKIQMGYKDLRLKLMSQILVGIKVLKLYAWEPYFEAKVTAIREEELGVIRKSAIVITLSYIVSFSSNLVVALLCFITYTLLSPDNVLTPDKAFVSISLFNVLSTPIMFVPTGLMFLMQALVSIERLQKFLLQPEISPDNVQHDPHKEGAINISDGTFSWGEAERVPLKDINLVVPAGSLVAVVGTVGSGKSSLLQAMLGEMDKVTGTVNMKGDVAYVPQQAWIQNLTVRDNILFDKPYVRNKYQKVLEACALTPDLKILQGGDMTEIGERGINLSGGQKQRVSLARAMYQNADVYLLDDPLSAVDSHVGKHIFEKVIGPYGQLSHTTRILVTNAVTYLPKMDRIVVLREGSISEVGSFDQLMANNGAFAEFLTQHISEQVESGVELDEEEREWARQVSAGTGGGGSLSGTEGDSFGTSGTSGTGVRRRRKTPAADRKPSALREAQKEALVAEEAVQEGTVQGAVIVAYLRACTFTWLFVMLIGLLINVGGNVGSNIWLSFWSNDALLAETTNVTTSVYLRLGVYGGLGLMQILGTFILVGAVAFGAIQAARTIHKSLLENNLKSPMSFFDTTPTGRILNRYSKDVDIVDTNMRNYIQNLVSNAAIILATLTIIVYTTPVFTAILVPLVIIFFILQRIYVKTARQVKRIDSTKRSPIYANFSETLNGISSIRAFRQQARFTAHADTLLDNSMKINYSVFISNRWIGIWLEMLGDVIVLFASIFSVVQRDALDPGTVGLSLSYALQVSWQIVLLVRYSCELETYIVAVERIKEYTDVIPEAPWLMEHRPRRDWPEDGAVDFRDYKTRYRAELGLVLKGLNCNIHAGEKVGIVGRTGAGKSSMTLALFRIIEAAGGSIYIDGENIAEMGLHDVRSKLTIIPQDPVLFSGSLRFNLDPADQYSDQQVWAALEQAHLKAFVESLPDTLSYESGEDGENFSVGQRQLVCLARALLRRSRILIMDEATAAVDLETDDLIQTTIRTEFRDSTVITIAHRLNTVLDYDKVMMMDDGLIREYDSPQALLADNTTMFYSMAADAGLV